MSLPSQVGRTPGRGPKVESRAEPLLGKNQVAAGAVVGVVMLAVIVFAVVALRGGPSGTAEPGAGTIRDPLASTERRGEPAATLPDADRAAPPRPQGDPALDLVLSGTPATESPTTPTPTGGDRPVAEAREPAGDAPGGDADAALDAVLSQPARSPTSGMLTGMFGEDEPEGGSGEGEDGGGRAIASADGELPAGLALSETDEVLRRARDLRDAGRLLAARDELNLALADAGDPADQARLREAIAALNETLVFSAHIEPGDSIAREYRVKSGDSLARIAKAQNLGTHWKLIARVNGIDNPSRINVGQRLKLVTGPFHAVVDKSDFRLDLYHGPASNPREWVYVSSMPVGLGAGDGTPVGQFVVAPGKLENPGWVNPRDSTERYDRDDPKNPIGEYWVGLQGVGDSAAHVGYGLHGTIEPESIGRTMSMGCVRLGDGDAGLVYELLTEGESVVHIVP